MNIDRALNLVMAVERDDGAKIHVHAQPIPLAIFNENALLLGKTFSTIYGQGLTWNAGPRVAALIMRETAVSLMGQDSGNAAADRLMAEIHRLTTVIVPSERARDGYETMLFDEAVKKGFMDEEDQSEIDSGLVFFSLAWRMHPKAERRPIVTSAARLWGGLTTSSNVMDFVASLRMSTEKESSGAKPMAALSVPS
jgi:hypothetical protein